MFPLATNSRLAKLSQYAHSLTFFCLTIVADDAAPQALQLFAMIRMPMNGLPQLVVFALSVSKLPISDMAMLISNLGLGLFETYRVISRRGGSTVPGSFARRLAEHIDEQSAYG